MSLLPEGDRSPMPPEQEPEDPVMRLEARPAGIDDWSDIRHLHASAISRLAGGILEPKQVTVVCDHVYSEDYMAHLAACDLWVGLLDRRVVASGGWIATDDSGRLARIEGIYVAPLFQRCGFGRQLLTLAEQRAVANGYRTLSARALQPAAGFFEAQGYDVMAHGTQVIGEAKGVPMVFLRRDVDRLTPAGR